MRSTGREHPAGGWSAPGTPFIPQAETFPAKADFFSAKADFFPAQADFFPAQADFLPNMADFFPTSGIVQVFRGARILIRYVLPD
ncbi:MAG: hypothetical protein HZA49_07745 [Planctomycetes bacterium]|nr:hypothetical protein [Planctomycetota bacterium]